MTSYLAMCLAVAVAFIARRVIVALLDEVWWQELLRI